MTLSDFSRAKEEIMTRSIMIFSLGNDLYLKLYVCIIMKLYLKMSRKT